MIKITSANMNTPRFKSWGDVGVKPRYWTVKQLSATGDCIHPTCPPPDPPDRGLEKEHPTGQTFGGV